MPNTVVVGAGVSGLTTALLLSRKTGYSATIVAKYVTGDNDIEYRSAWAGANVTPWSLPEDCRWERDTWPELARLAKDVPEAGIHFQKSNLLLRQKPTDPSSCPPMYQENPWYKDVLPKFRVLPKDEIPAGYAAGNRVTSICINLPIYLAYLQSECLKNGVVLKRAVLRRIEEASDMHHTGKKADVIINCTGLQALKLRGVEDKNMIPIRGQTILIRNSPKGSMYLSEDQDVVGEVCYIMERAAGGGTLLGGMFQKGIWDSEPDPNTAIRIMKRAMEMCPALTEGKGIEALSIIRHAVGFRPHREGGIRVEKEKIGETLVVYNYGHGGGGYQSSYACSEEVLRLVEESLGSS